MRFFGPLLFAGACLAACSQSEVESAVETARQIETQPASNRAEETEILDLHYCYAGSPVKQKAPVHPIALHLAASEAFKEGPLKRMRERSEAMAENAATGTPPSEKEFKRISLENSILTILINRHLSDQNAQLNMQFCNFGSYVENKCAHLASRNFIETASMNPNGQTLTFITTKSENYTLDQPYTKFGRRHYGSLTEVKDGVTARWTRTIAGIESFTTTATEGVQSWTEKPDCSGKLQHLTPETTFTLNWSAPTKNDVTLQYEYCDAEGCLNNQF